MVLHTVNNAPHSSHCLADCLRLISAPAALILIEEGAYAATVNNEALFRDLDAGIDCYVLQPDVDARGLSALISSRFTPVSDSGFVTLSIQCTRIQSWY
ncbi:MAG: sulfur relay protein TusB/DsrH [Motiliproteus sp.]|jgi:sulfur relay protein TusB/DsrH